MSIHTLQDLCYACRVADPVREMLFALQDRIDALGAQRKPLSDEEIHNLDPFPHKLFDQERLDFARAIEAKLKERNT